jgi:hypothetical protein
LFETKQATQACFLPSFPGDYRGIHHSSRHKLVLCSVVFCTVLHVIPSTILPWKVACNAVDCWWVLVLWLLVCVLIF